MAAQHVLFVIYVVEILVLEDCLNDGNPSQWKIAKVSNVCSNFCSSLGHVMSDVAVVNYFVNILTVIYSTSLT